MSRQAGVPAAGSPLLSREQARALADRVLAMSAADETRVTISSGWSIGGGCRPGAR